MKTTKRGKGTGRGSGRIGRTMSSEQRHAASAFLDGFWIDERKGQFAALLAALWRDYQSEPDYEALRQGLSDAARHRR